MGKSKIQFLLGVAGVLILKWWVVPALPALAAADFFTRYIPLSLAPLNWALCLALIAICEGPLLLPKYLSISFNVLWVASVLFFLGSWHFHPYFSPVVAVIGYIEMNWCQGRSETRPLRRRKTRPDECAGDGIGREGGVWSGGLRSGLRSTS
jgi:hypothetical protein